MDYEYIYSGKDLAHILREKLNRLKDKLIRQEQEKSAVPKVSGRFGESVSLDIDKDIEQSVSMKAENTRLDIKKCEVMIIEMERDKRRKYSLSLGDLIWLRY
jgi:hypothetical protein